MRKTGRAGRWAGPLVSAVLVAVQVLGWAPLAIAQEPGDPVELRGFATGQPAHFGALEAGGTRAVDTEVAWSGATVDADADGLKGEKINEVNRIFQPDKAGKLTYARGSGLEVGLGTTPADPNQAILAGLAEADAPPRSSATEDIEVDGDPIAHASLVRGQAVANSNDSGLVPDVCVLGDDLSRGVGYAADVELVDTGGDESSPEFDGALIALDDQEPQRSVSQSTSRMTLVPTGRPNNFGLSAEVAQTIAPVTILQADDDDPTTAVRTVTIEFLGVWILRVVATGHAGGATVHYGPGEASPSTPILRIIDSADPPGDDDTIVQFQDIFGEEGLNIPIPGLLDLTIGEDPRAIAKPGTIPDPASKPTTLANGTMASAAVDVVRLKLLSQPDPEAADIRIGHMEVSTQVPAGGINCPIPVTKTAKPDNIRIREEPDTSVVGITVHNVYDCDLVDVVLTDRIRQREGDPDFKLIDSEPTAKSPKMPTGNLRTADVVWELGTIAAGAKKSVTLDVQSATKGGILRDIAEAVGKMANCAGEDVAGLAIAGLTLTGISNPVDIKIEIPVTGAAAARTLVTGGAIAAMAIGSSFVLRRRFARKT